MKEKRADEGLLDRQTLAVVHERPSVLNKINLIFPLSTEHSQLRLAAAYPARRTMHEYKANVHHTVMMSTRHGRVLRKLHGQHVQPSWTRRRRRKRLRKRWPAQLSCSARPSSRLLRDAWIVPGPGRDKGHVRVALGSHVLKRRHSIIGWERQHVDI
jgi:hypothetical protein